MRSTADSCNQASNQLLEPTDNVQISGAATNIHSTSALPVLNHQPDAETTMAVHRATGLPVMQAKEFIRTSSPDLVERILAGHQIRYATQLASLPAELAGRIEDASARQRLLAFLHDPIEDDSTVGPIVRSVMEQASREMEAKHGRVLGLCHAVWHRTRERLLQEHSIVWYSPAQMNPGSCFD